MELKLEQPSPTLKQAFLSYTEDWDRNGEGRRKGYAEAMLTLVLPLAERLGIGRVLVTCAKDNAASARTILHCGGVLENEIAEGGRITQRYWIDLARFPR